MTCRILVSSGPPAPCTFTLLLIIHGNETLIIESSGIQNTGPSYYNNISSVQAHCTSNIIEFMSETKILVEEG